MKLTSTARITQITRCYWRHDDFDVTLDLGNDVAIGVEHVPARPDSPLPSDQPYWRIVVAGAGEDGFELRLDDEQVQALTGALVHAIGATS